MRAGERGLLSYFASGTSLGSLRQPNSRELRRGDNPSDESFSFRLVAGLIWLLVAVWPLLTIRESLWIDELHSSWVVAGSWSDVAPRAAVGNQSPLYYWGIKSICECSRQFELLTGVELPPELKIRGLSWLAWLALTFVLFQHFRDSLGATLIAAVWLVIDRIGVFYAIEARPYIVIAFLSFVMLRTTKWPEPSSALSRHFRGIDILWIVCAVTAFYLHYTAAVLVFWSWLARFVVTRFQTTERASRSTHLGRRFLEGGILVIAIFPGLLHFLKIGSHSQQWSGFAGDASWIQLIDLLPWLSFCVVPLVFWLLHSNQLDRNKPLFVQASFIVVGMIFTVWMTTILNIAPLMHRRYILGAFPACIIFGLILIQSIRSRATILAIGIVSVILLGWWQGTFREWSHGRWTAWQRQEDWRAASVFVNQHSKIDEPIFIAPMLIETLGSSLDPRLPRDYLVSPLTTVYAIEDQERLEPLPNDTKAWPSLIRAQLKDANAKSAWLVARTYSPTLVSDLNSAENRPSRGQAAIEFASSLYAGRLQIVKIRIE